MHEDSAFFPASDRGSDHKILSPKLWGVSTKVSLKLAYFNCTNKTQLLPPVPCSADFACDNNPSSWKTRGWDCWKDPKGIAPLSRMTSQQKPLTNKMNSSPQPIHQLVFRGPCPGCGNMALHVSADQNSKAIGMGKLCKQSKKQFNMLLRGENAPLPPASAKRASGVCLLEIQSLLNMHAWGFLNMLLWLTGLVNLPV